MIFEQPYDPISLGMDICILSRDTPETSRVGTVRACCVVVDSWVVYRVELHSALSAKTLLLYVPVIWADVSSYMSLDDLTFRNGQSFSGLVESHLVYSTRSLRGHMFPAVFLFGAK